MGVEKSSSIFGAVEPLKTIIPTGLNKKILYITSDFVTAGRVFELYQNMFGERACQLKPTPDNLVFTKFKSVETLVENSISLSKIASGQIDVVVAPINSVLKFYPTKQDILKTTINLKVNQVIEPKKLAEKLVQAGYIRQDLAGEASTFSLRGDVLDVFPIGSEIAYRIDFFDKDIEVISEIDISTMKKGKSVKSLSIYPCKNVFIEEKEKIEILNYIDSLKNKKYSDQTSKDEFLKVLNELEFRLTSGEQNYNLDFIMPLVKNKSSILEYFDDFVIVIDECKIVYDQAKEFDADYQKRIKELSQSGNILSKNGNYYTFEELKTKLQDCYAITYQKLTNTNRFYEPKVVFQIKSSPLSRYTHSFKDFVKDIKKYDYDGYKNILFARDEAGAKNIKNTLTDYEVEFDIAKNTSISKCADVIVPAEFASGFVLPEFKIVVFGTYDFLPRKMKENKLKASRGNVFSVPKVGDYVVHSFHGVGLCEGVKKLSGNFGTKDYVVVSYRDGDKLYVPIDQMNMLDRYTGAEAPKKLSKIGGVEFAKVKEKVKSSVRKLAFDLVELYAKRESKKGFVYDKDTDLQVEFENSFAHTETEDQLISISEIKQDMEKGKVMDRLLCGDVGFGKTEVALRAAFKAIVNGKQVAIVAPTTILSEQHYNTTKLRMNNFGVQVEVLNRFKTPKQIKQILEGLAKGSVDVVCGTHRVLSKDVNFKDLGLIILDEEQKFGVEDKEKIKLKYPNVDVLTLSATPIPRTLHMSLSGIRDVSIISTPPSQRLPISTYVTEYSENLIKDAVTKEIMRNGQVFILYNSVQKIYAFADRIKKLLPDARVIVGHGQMPGKQLEDIIYQFYSGQADVLICTTIIENGIDIENANTLIVCDSDKFGLSQLYQLRGRVGRGNRLAYAYFTYDNSKVLTEEAYKRLDAISEFTEFGSGFKLAMRDLEIRGSGTILGAEQHGHMEKVGYELYSKLLAEAVSEIKGDKVKEDNDVVINISIDAFIPDTYITTSEDRMVAYKTIATIKTLEDKNKVIYDFEQAFGNLPKPTRNLIDIAFIKAKAKKLEAQTIVWSHKALEIVFDNKDKIIGNELIGDLVYKFRFKCSLDFSKMPKIVFKNEENIEKNFELLKEFMAQV